MNSDERQIIRRRRGVVLNDSGLERLRVAIATLEAQQNNGIPYSVEELSTITGVSPSTVRRLRAAKSGIDQRSLQQIFSALNLELQDNDFRWVDSQRDTRSESVPERCANRIDAGSAIEELANAPQSVTAYRYPSGPLPLASPLYIARSPIEELAFQEITQVGCVVRIKAPPQFGKSSLLLRILHQAQQLGHATAAIDLQQVGAEVLGNCDRPGPDAGLSARRRWYSQGFSHRLANQLRPLPPVFSAQAVYRIGYFLVPTPAISIYSFNHNFRG